MAAVYYTKTTVVSETLLNRGLPQEQYFEIDAGRVVRLIRIRNGFSEKESLESMAGICIGTLVDWDADLTLEEINIANAGSAFIERVDGEEFERCWLRAKWSLDSWRRGP